MNYLKLILLAVLLASCGERTTFLRLTAPDARCQPVLDEWVLVSDDYVAEFATYGAERGLWGADEFLDKIDGTRVVLRAEPWGSNRLRPGEPLDGEARPGRIDLVCAVSPNETELAHELIHIYQFPERDPDHHLGTGPWTVEHNSLVGDFRRMKKGVQSL